jgi:hypothetical protein
MGVLAGVLGIFRRSGIRTTEALADFLDERATLLAQDSVDEYIKGRAGPIAATIFADVAFGAALERARREAYPIALTMLAQAVEGVLHPHAGDKAADVLRALEGVVLSVFDRHPVPAGLSPQAWLATRDDVLRWLDDLPRRRPKLAADITEPFAPLLLALMPIHDMLHGENFPALQNYLRDALSGIHDEFFREARPRALIAALLRRR